MKRISFALAVVLLACGPLAAQQSEPAALPDSDEVAVYEAVIRHMASPVPAFVVVNERTWWRDGPGGPSWEPRMDQGLDAARVAVIKADFVARNRAPVTMPDRLGSIEVRRFRPGDFFGKIGPAAWPRFNEQFGTRAYYSVSRPGFDATRTRAMIYASMSCGGLCGHGSMLVLSRTAPGWTVTHEERLWVS